MKSAVLAIMLTAVAMPALAQSPATPYAGQQARAIKALSHEDVAALLKGEGMGMAKAAELNGYPGPAHVIPLAKELKLTDEQLREVTAIQDRMSGAAKPLGAELVERERALDGLFATGAITPERLGAETAAIGELEGRLRAVHLRAHVATRALLSQEQIATYERRRGYNDPTSAMQHHHG
jgi:hypothetical protein